MRIFWISTRRHTSTAIGLIAVLGIAGTLCAVLLLLAQSLLKR